MTGGFSFCGVDIGFFDIIYAPDMSSTYVYGQTYSEHAESFEGYHGALSYGNTVRPKEFRLRCYFEDQKINSGIIDKVQSFFYRGRTGRLVFMEQDWLWYVATVTSVDTSQFRNYRNGVITINMKANYPFGRTDILNTDSISTTDPYILNKTGLISSLITPEVEYTNISSNRSVMLYNPGNEYAHVAIEISGNAGDGITIINKENNQECKVVAFDRAQTSNIDKYIVVDSLNGKTVITDGTNAELGFIYHDHGFITLAPSPIVKRYIVVSYNGNTVTCNQLFDPSDVGKYLYISGTWYKINSFIDVSTVTVEDGGALEGVTGSYMSHIVTMNKIDIQLSAGAIIDRLKFVYKPTFR